MTKDALGDRMKRYEMEDAQQRLMLQLPIMARLDGRAFHTFTRGLRRPYDEAFSQCMIDTMKALVKEFKATLAYTQSDEITLYFKNDDPFATMEFDGRKHKYISLLASEATGSFITALMEHLPAKLRYKPRFDCRVWNLPNQTEVFNCFLWREKDATKNSLSMAAQAHYSAKELHRKGRQDLHELLYQKGINWNDYPAYFKRGSYARRIQTQIELSPEQLARIPEHKRESAGIRTAISCVDMPPIETFDATSAGMSFIHGLPSRKDLA
jgi:tRNA(His) guanylyltransferase